MWKQFNFLTVFEQFWV